MRRPGRTFLVLAGPYFLLLLAFMGAPLLNVLAMSVFRYDPTVIWRATPTLENYAHVFEDAFYTGLILKTLGMAAGATAIAAVAAYPLAYFLARCSRRLLPVGLFFLVMPLMVSAVVRAFGWIVLLGRRGALDTIGVGAFLNTQTGVMIALMHFVLPVMVLPLMASIERIPRSLEEAAANLGWGGLAAFRAVVLPLTIPGLASGMVLSFTVSASAVVIPALVGGRRGRMFGNEIYDQVVTSFNWPLASALAVLLVGVTLVLVGVGLLAGRRGQVM